MAYSGSTGGRALNRFLANQGLIQTLDSNQANIAKADIGEINAGVMNAADATVVDLSAINMNVTNEFIGETIVSSTATFTTANISNINTGSLNAINSIINSVNGTNLTFTNAETQSLSTNSLVVSENVGIGITNPSLELEVDGDISASGNVIAGGTILTFTGAHRTNPNFIDNISDYTIYNGLILSSSGINFNRKEITNFHIETHLCTEKYDKKVSGIYYARSINNSHYSFSQLSLGEGMMWVCDIAGAIQNGDYITSSDIYGFGMLQDDDLLHNYTVAKSYENVDFTDYDRLIKIVPGFIHVYNNSDKLLFSLRGNFPGEYYGHIYKSKLIGCTFHCG